MSVASPSLRELMVKIESLPMQRIAQVNDFVEFLRMRVHPSEKTAITGRTDWPNDRQSLDFPVISVGQWPEDLSLRREDLYGDDGR